jgi:hypothetical protein
MYVQDMLSKPGDYSTEASVRSAPKATAQEAFRSGSIHMPNGDSDPCE